MEEEEEEEEEAEELEEGAGDLFYQLQADASGQGTFTISSGFIIDGDQSLPNLPRLLLSSIVAQCDEWVECRSGRRMTPQRERR